LSDLTFLEDGNPDMLGNLINFEKRRLICNTIIEIITYQQTAYNLRSVPKIENLLLKVPVKTDSELYQMSLLREPREKTT
jgi:son of sevenless-like protein